MVNFQEIPGVDIFTDKSRKYLRKKKINEAFNVAKFQTESQKWKCKYVLSGPRVLFS